MPLGDQPLWKEYHTDASEIKNHELQAGEVQVSLGDEGFYWPGSEECRRSGLQWAQAHADVDLAIRRQQHKEITGRVQTGKAGLGWAEALWVLVEGQQEREKRELVVSEVANMENECLKIKAKGAVQRGMGLLAEISAWWTCGGSQSQGSVYLSGPHITHSHAHWTCTCALARKSAAPFAVAWTQALTTSSQAARLRSPRDA